MMIKKDRYMSTCGTCNPTHGCDDGRFIHGDTSRILDLRCKLTENLKGLTYQGPWNAYINWPSIPPADETNEGYYFIVSVPGNSNIDGINEWELNDWVVSNGESWVKVDNSETVLSVNGEIGHVLVKTLYDSTGTHRVLVPVINEDKYLVFDDDPIFSQILDLVNFKHGHKIEKRNLTLFDINNKFILLTSQPNVLDDVEVRVLGAPIQDQGQDFIMDSLNPLKLKWIHFDADTLLDNSGDLKVKLKSSGGLVSDSTGVYVGSSAITNDMLAGNIATSKLADAANIAFLNENETVTGTKTL